MSGGPIDSREVADCVARLEHGVRELALEIVEAIFAAELARIAGELQSESAAPLRSRPGAGATDRRDGDVAAPRPSPPPPIDVDVLALAPMNGATASVESAPHPPAASVGVEAPVPAVDSSLELGTVKWFSDQKGYGFIAGDDGKDVFVHRRSLVAGGLRTLRDGQRVRYAEEEGAKGPVATRVSAA